MRTQLIGVAALVAMTATAAAGRGPTPVASQTPVPLPAQGGRAGASTPPRTGTGVLIGRVVEAESARPLLGVMVALSGSGASQKVHVDAQGRFLFTGLPDGVFQLSATKAGYFGGFSGQSAPKGPTRPVELAPGERRGDVVLRLWKYAAISGRVLGEAGEPAVAVEVNLVERRLVDGQRVFAGRPYPAVTTDDRGVFRFGQVVPGDYVLFARTPADLAERALMAIAMADQSALASVASSAASGHIEDAVEADSTLRVYPPTFYPSTTSPAEAESVVVNAGDDRTAVDIRARAIGVGTISGAFTHEGKPVTGARVFLTTNGGEGRDIEVASTSTRAEGRFGFVGVPAMPYTLRIVRTPSASAAAFRGAGAGVARGRAGQPPLPADPTLWAVLPVVVGDPASRGLTIEGQPGGRLRGRVDWSGSAPRLLPEQMGSLRLLAVSATAVPGLPATGLGRIETDGTFSTAGLAPGRYRLRVDGPTPWRAASAMADGVDLLDVARDISASDIDDIVITMVDTPTATLTGVVRNAQNAPDTDAVVLILPGDERLIGDRRMRMLRTTKEGAYMAPGLPAGEYVVVAVDDKVVDAGLDRTVLTRLLQLGTRTTLNDGERKTVDLRGGTR